MTRLRWPSRKIGALLLALPVLAAGGCQTVPATGKRAFIIMPESQELALGAQAAPEFLKSYGGEIPDAEVRQYVNQMGHRLAEVSERPGLPWEFHAVNSPEINAFALPGGKVFVTRGLMQLLQNEAQLAGVMGHECGHVTAMHIPQQMSQQMVVTGLVSALGAAAESTNKDYLKALGVGAQAGGALYMLKFSRDDESQADALGVRYMSKLGYNPVAQIQVMEILQKAAGSGGTLEILATHPYPETRIQRLTAEIKKSYPQYDANPPVYAFNEGNYKAHVLDRLARLPPAPKPPPQSGGASGLRGR
jgi:predicted Zn-dependent protease